MEKRIKEILALQPSEDTIKAEGWVRTKRDSKNVSFIEINDGSCLKGLQCVIDKNVIGSEILDKISTGASVIAEGKIVPSQGGNQKTEMATEKLQIVISLTPRLALALTTFES